MRLIDADALIEDCNILDAWDAKIVKAWCDDQPTAYGLYVCDGCKYEPVHPQKSPCRSCGRTMVDYYERGGNR